MKILFLIETLGNGGAERVLVNSVPALQKLGIDCEVAILFNIDDLAEELEVQRVKVHRLHLSYKWNVIEGIYKLNQLLKINNYDIIHAHLFFAYFYAGLVKLFYPDLKTVTTFHNLGYNTYPANTMIKKLRKKLDAFVINRLIDSKVAVGNEVKKHYTKHLSISNVDLIFNSFPLEMINNALKTERHEILKQYVDIDTCDTFSITPGRLVKEKGHFYLLDALELLDKNSMNLCHFIVGAGPLEAEIKKKIESKRLLNIILIPGLAQSELFELIKACDFVVIPSISEGFPMVVGECMALDKPIVATEISGVVDMIENQKEGLLIPPENPQVLAEAITRMMEDSVLRELFSANAKEKIKQFDTKKIALQWKQYYEKMLNG